MSGDDLTAPLPDLGGKLTYTLQEAADLLRISYGAMAQRVRFGQVKKCPFGKPIRIPAIEMRRLLGMSNPEI